MTASRIVFAGTPEFAEVILRALLADRSVEVVAAYTQPDRPAGRGRPLTASRVKLTALAHGIPVRQPATLRDPGELVTLAQFRADFLVVAAYGILLPQAALDAALQAPLNVHASLLPRWRGAAPIQRALLAGDTQTGVSIMHMIAALDAGPIYAQQRCDIAAQDTFQTLHDRLAAIGAQCLLATLAQIRAGSAEARAQDAAHASYAAKIGRADRSVDWRQDAISIERAVRALAPAPGLLAELNGLPCKILGAEVIARTGAPGTVLAAGAAGIDVASGCDALRILQLQPAGGTSMTVAEFLRGHRVI